MTSSEQRLSHLELGLILVLATLPRLFGLGHVSLWLDEILSSLRVGESLAEAWRAWQANPVHPPLYEFLQWIWFQVVEPEPLRRLLPVTLGVSTIGVLAHLACRWFGRRVAWCIALIAALSPVHIRYSQELRMYALGLLCLVLALVASEWALERRSWSGWAVLGLTLSLCFWSLYISVVVLVPVVLNIVQTIAGRSTRRRELAGLALALSFSVVLFLPWISVVEQAAAKVHEQQATEWRWSLLGQRWQFLTVGGVEGEPLSLASILFAGLVTVGAIVAVRSSPGRSVLAGAFAGTVGIEIILWLTDHWTNGRYCLMAWPFLVMLAGLGVGRLYELGQRWSPRSFPQLGAWLGALPLLLVLLGEAAGVGEYFRRGRQDWQAVARNVSTLASPDRPILVNDAWTQLSLGYYLAYQEGAKGEISSRPRIVPSGVDLGDLVGEGCTVLVVAGWSGSPGMERLLLETPVQRNFLRSGARIAGVGPSASDLWTCWPDGIEEMSGERPAPLRSIGNPSSAKASLELTAEDQPLLRFGWSYPERTAGGMTYRWAVGRWSAVDLSARRARTLRLEAWALSDDQVLTVYRGRQSLATLPLSTTRQTLEVGLPADFGAAGDETILFSFADYASPQENPRPLAAAFDRIELVP